MRNAIFAMLFSIVGSYALTGCAGSNESPGLPPKELPSQISLVSISREASIDPRINLPGPNNQGSIASIIEDRRESNFNEKILEMFDYRKFILEELHKEFREQISQSGAYELVSSERAEAEFVLEIQRIELTTKHSLLHDRLRKLSPSIHLTARLIKNPPIELVKTEMGKIEPMDPKKNPILYQKTVTSSHGALPNYLKEDYMNEAVFKSAFESAIKVAVAKLMPKQAYRDFLDDSLRDDFFGSESSR